MPKKFFQDVTPPGSEGGRRSIRDVVINKKTRTTRTEPKEISREVDREEPVQHVREEIQEREVHTSHEYDLPPQPERYSPSDNPVDLERFAPSSGNKKKLSSKVFIGAALVAIGIFVFVMMNAFTSAKIEIVPKKETASFNLAVKALSVSNASTSPIKYEVIPIKADKSADVKATGSEQVERKASAQVMLYNNFSSDPQRLIARTRFQTPEGLIFRISDSVTIPGKTADKPGSIQVTLLADEAGDKYNVGLKDWTIPGFQDDAARFKGFYGRSVTPATGGFIGKANKVADADKKAAIDALQKSMMDDVEKQLTSKIDPSLVVLKGGIVYDWSELPQQDSNSDTATVSEHADAYAIAFSKKDASSLIESQFLKAWNGMPADITDYSNMTLSFDDPTWRPTQSDAVAIKIVGSATLEATIDSSAIANRLAGKNKSELSAVINDSKAINSATASVRPVWKSSFPNDPAKISISVSDQ